MKKLGFVITLAALLNAAHGQKFTKSLQSLIDAENAFANTSKKTNTVNAFVSFLSPTATLLFQGEEANGIETWKKREADSSLLFWYPVFADISISQDFGYTTGPFSYYGKRSDTVPAFRGFYSTVWEKEKGVWKILFDLGGGISSGDESTLTSSRVKSKTPEKKQSREEALGELMNFDKAYDAHLMAKGISFDPAHFSAEGRIHRPRQLPVTGAENIKTFKEDNQKFEMTAMNGKIASSSDMGYTYGKAKVTISKDGSDRTIDLSYFRIWKKEDGIKWKIVLDVIGQ